MLNAFAAAAAVMFKEPNRSVQAKYASAGAEWGPKDVRVIVGAPSDRGEFGDISYRVETVVVMVQTSDVSAPQKGDRITLPGGKIRVVQSAPEPDALGIWWVLDTRPSDDDGW